MPAQPMENPLPPPEMEELILYYDKCEHYDDGHVNAQLGWTGISRVTSISRWCEMVKERPIAPNSYFDVDHYKKRYGVGSHLTLYDFLEHGWQVGCNPNAEICIAGFLSARQSDIFSKKVALKYLLNDSLVSDFQRQSSSAMGSGTVTIITINLNNRAGLERTIQSISTQAMTDFQWIFVDGGSTDGSLELVEQSSRKPDISIIGLDKGLFDAMNLGVAQASQEYVVFLNSGDTFSDENTLGLVKQSLGLHDVVYGDAQYMNETRPHTHRTQISRGMTFCHQSEYARTEWLRRFPFDTSLQMADLGLNQELYLNGAIFHRLPETISVIEPGGFSTSNAMRQFLERMSLAAERFPHPALQNTFLMEFVSRPDLNV